VSKTGDAAAIATLRIFLTDEDIYNNPVFLAHFGLLFKYCFRSEQRYIELLVPYAVPLQGGLLLAQIVAADVLNPGGYQHPEVP
jgi:hypothetical protein